MSCEIMGKCLSVFLLFSNKQPAACPGLSQQSPSSQWDTPSNTCRRSQHEIDITHTPMHAIRHMHMYLNTDTHTTYKRVLFKEKNISNVSQLLTLYFGHSLLRWLNGFLLLSFVLNGYNELILHHLNIKQKSLQWLIFRTLVLVNFT